MRACMLVGQSCPTLCNPVDCSLPGSSLPGILLVRILEWADISFSRGSSQPMDLLHCRHILYHLSHQGSPNLFCLSSMISINLKITFTDPAEHLLQIYVIYVQNMYKNRSQLNIKSFILPLKNFYQLNIDQQLIKMI